ncbi:MAG: ABC transporter permease [Actinomycetota bacterium]|nr:ABC transporter permease [Actinomycetota bacterium]
MPERRTPTPQLLWQQVRYENKLFWRTPVAAFFTLIFPLMFLVLFELLFGGQAVPGELSVAQFFAPSLAVFAAASATYTNLGIGVSIARDQGILKRVRGTPLPPWIYLAGRIGSGIWIAFLGTVLMLGVGVLVYDLQVRVATLPAATLAFLVGVATFAALGLTLAAFSPTGDSAPAIANVTLLPLAFISDVFIPLSEDAPRWLQLLGGLFPLKHFVHAFQHPFNPFVQQAGRIQWDHLAVMAAWGVVGVVLALRFFSWEPRHGERVGRRRRRRRRAADEGAS